MDYSNFIVLDKLLKQGIMLGYYLKEINIYLSGNGIG